MMSSSIVGWAGNVASVELYKHAAYDILVNKKRNDLWYWLRISRQILTNGVNWINLGQDAF
jgi:hypothetical protein